VQEERRLGVDNQPYGKTGEALEELAYDNPAYAHSVIGSMQDLNAAAIDDVASFFTTYYAPNNAVLAIVGDVSPPEGLAKVRKFFEAIPSQPAASTVDLTEPPQKQERRLVLGDALARLSRLDVAYKVPPSLTADDDALGVLSTILAGGRSSRMYEAIVRQRQLAPNINTFKGESRGPGLLRVIATPSPHEHAESAIEARSKNEDGPDCRLGDGKARRQPELWRAFSFSARDPEPKNAVLQRSWTDQHTRRSHRRRHRGRTSSVSPGILTARMHRRLTNSDIRSAEVPEAAHARRRSRFFAIVAVALVLRSRHLARRRTRCDQRQAPVSDDTLRVTLPRPAAGPAGGSI
jgi:hypothetical protein